MVIIMAAVAVAADGLLRPVTEEQVVEVVEHQAQQEVLRERVVQVELQVQQAHTSIHQEQPPEEMVEQTQAVAVAVADNNKQAFTLQMEVPVVQVL